MLTAKVLNTVDRRFLIYTSLTNPVTTLRLLIYTIGSDAALFSDRASVQGRDYAYAFGVPVILWLFIELVILIVLKHHIKRARLTSYALTLIFVFILLGFGIL